MHTSVPVVTDNHHGFPYQSHRADNIIIHSIHSDFMYRSRNTLFYTDLIPTHTIRDTKYRFVFGCSPPFVLYRPTHYSFIRPLNPKITEILRIVNVFNLQTCFWITRSEG